MRLVLVGPPGSGKGTQAERLCDRLGLTYVGTGDILRDAIRRQTPIGQQVDPLMRQGLLVPDPVVNDRVGATAVVVLGKPETRSVRAYERGALSFRQGAGPAELIETASGARWRVEEERLVEPATGRTLPRVGGHVAFWFGWHAFFPDAEVYVPPR